MNFVDLNRMIWICWLIWSKLVPGIWCVSRLDVGGDMFQKKPVSYCPTGCDYDFTRWLGGWQARIDQITPGSQVDSPQMPGSKVSLYGYSKAIGLMSHWILACKANKDTDISRCKGMYSMMSGNTLQSFLMMVLQSSWVCNTIQRQICQVRQAPQRLQHNYYRIRLK